MGRIRLYSLMGGAYVPSDTELKRYTQHKTVRQVQDTPNRHSHSSRGGMENSSSWSVGSLKSIQAHFWGSPNWNSECSLNRAQFCYLEVFSLIYYFLLVLVPLSSKSFFTYRSVCSWGEIFSQCFLCTEIWESRSFFSFWSITVPFSPVWSISLNSFLLILPGFKGSLKTHL